MEMYVSCFYKEIKNLLYSVKLLSQYRLNILIILYHIKVSHKVELDRGGDETTEDVIFHISVNRLHYITLHWVCSVKLNLLFTYKLYNLFLLHWNGSSLG